MADFVQNMDPKSLVTVGTILSFALSPFTAPTYNFPLFLFGVYAQENAEAAQSLKLFTYLLGGSTLFDIIWIIRHKQNWFIGLLSVILFLFKIPTVFAFLAVIRQRGDQLSGLGIRTGDLSGPTLWSMPGGFSSLGGQRSGYEPVDPESGAESNSRVPPPPAPKTTHTGSTAQDAPASGGQAAPGGYQTV